MVQCFLFVALFERLEYARWLGAVGTLLMLPKAGSITRGNKKLSFTVFVIDHIISAMASFMVVLVFVLVVSTAAFLNLLGSGSRHSSSPSAPPAAALFGSFNDMGGRRSHDGLGEYANVGIASFTMFRLLLGDFDPDTYIVDHEINFATVIFAATMFFVNIVRAASLIFAL